MTKTCPECQTALVWNAQKCRCGWRESARTEAKATLPCCASGCLQPSLVRVPDGGSYCEFHYGQWWANNYAKVEKQPVDNPMCNEIREAYSRSHLKAKGNLEVYASDVAERIAA